MTRVRIAVFAAGEKGRAFLSDVIDDDQATVVEVRTYAQTGTIDESDRLIEQLCEARGIRFLRGARSRGDLAADIDLIFVVGWQYLLPPDPRMVVFHDSLLPRYRGFAPTVTALIAGEPQIGVSALRPVGEPDAGPILAQHRLSVTYPAKIRDVLVQLSDSYASCAREVIGRFAQGTLTETPQDPDEATYSIWRDDEDYLINWAEDADRICRTIDALGWPYTGARTRLGTTTLTVLGATPGPDLRFEVTQPGKLWSLSDGVPTVMCGTGTVVLTDVRTAEGEPYVFERLRARLV